MSSISLSPKQRFLRSLLLQPVDRIAVGNPTSVATIESMTLSGAFFPEAHLNPLKMADLAATGFELLGFDAIAPYFSVIQEAAAFGLEVDWGNIDNMPHVIKSNVNNPEDIHIPIDFLDREPIETVLTALRLLKKEYGNHVCLIGKVMGPWTLSYHLHGVQEFLIKTIEDPDKIRSFLNQLKECSLLFAKAQLEAGADVITIADHATGDLVSPMCYHDFLLPIHQEMAERLMCPTILHICGNTIDRLDYICQTGFNCFHFDSKVNPVQAKETATDRISLAGSINNPQTLLKGNPDDVEKEVIKNCAAGIDIICPECAVPVQTLNANLKAIVTSVERFCSSN